MKRVIVYFITITFLTATGFSARPSEKKKVKPCSCCSVTEKTTKPVPESKYPKVTKDGIKFVYEGKANEVFIKGSFNAWTEQPLKKEKENFWSITIPIPAGKYQYGFVVDGKYITDPKNPNKITTPEGFVNSLLHIPMPSGYTAPEITKDGVKFAYYAPKAKKVSLAGDFNNWSTTADLLKKDKSGEWVIVKKIPIGVYKYKFVIDDVEWVKDPFGIDAGDEYDNSIIKVLPAEGIELGPKITPEGVIFTYYAPEANRVVLSGDFNRWSTTADVMKKEPKTNVWSITKQLKRGVYKYKFVVDGEWIKDPFGTSAFDEYDNSIIEVK